MNKVAITSGILSGLSLIGYFLLMRLLGFHHNIQLHYFNIIILFLGLWYAIKHIKTITGTIKYFEGLKAGVIVTILSILIFNIFMLIYETVIDPSFLTFLSEKISLGNLFSDQETAIDVFGIISIEGLSSGFIMTFMLMQYYKSEKSETE